MAVILDFCASSAKSCFERCALHTDDVAGEGCTAIQWRRVQEVCWTATTTPMWRGASKWLYRWWMMVKKIGQVYLNFTHDGSHC